MKRICYRIQSDWRSEDHTAKMKMNGRRKRERRWARVAIWNRNRWEKRRRLKRERKIKMEEEEEVEEEERRRREKAEKKCERNEEEVWGGRGHPISIFVLTKSALDWNGNWMILSPSIYILYSLMHLRSSFPSYSLPCSLALRVLTYDLLSVWFIRVIALSTSILQYRIRTD